MTAPLGPCRNDAIRPNTTTSKEILVAPHHRDHDPAIDPPAMRALIGTGCGENVGHQPGQHFAEQPANEADYKRSEHIRQHGERLAHHDPHRVE